MNSVTSVVRSCVFLLHLQILSELSGDVEGCGSSANSILRSCFGAQAKIEAIDSARFNDAFGTPVSSLGDLNCGFESSCCWGELPVGELDWYKVSGRVTQGSVNRCFGTREVPDGDFIAAYSDAADSSGRAVLASCSVECTDTGLVEVSFKHWRSDDVILEVCSVGTFTGSINACRAIVGANPGPSTAQVPVPKCGECSVAEQDRVPVDIYITARNFVNGNKGGVAAIDDITVGGGSAGTCDDSGPIPPDGGGGSCTAACDFASSSLCSYSSLNTGTGWQTFSNQRVGNPDTGVPGAAPGSDGRFAAANLTPNQKAVMQSASLSRNGGPPSRLSFKYFEAGTEMQLKVCFDGESNCPFTTNRDVQLGDRAWKDTTLDLQGSVDTVSFVAETGNNFGAVGVDDIQVLNSAGIPQC